VADGRFVPKPGEVVVVSQIPSCDFCYDERTLGPYDFATRMGPWAHGCEEHWRLYRAAPRLGVGVGQLWITADQVSEAL
jgi:hypothetical protein